MTYDVLLSEEAKAYYTSLDEKSQRICRDHLGYLEENPYPGRGQGDKKQLKAQDEEVYRLHIGRTHTVFYIVLEDQNEVRVVDITTIDEAHKRYGR